MEFNPLWMLIILVVLILAGYYVGFVMGGIGILIGVLFFGPNILGIITSRVFIMQTEFVLVAIPLFLLMGNLLGECGAIDQLYGALHLWMGRLPGGLALATIVVCTIFAAAVGVASASIITMGLIALPSMLKRGYDKKLAGGTVMAGGILGVLIPPSVLLVLYGVFAEVSVGRLFMACVFPGLILSALYLIYILVRTSLRPQLAPPMSEEDLKTPMRYKISLLATSIIPPIFLIFAVLGSILLGVATPTEAAGVGVAGTIMVAVAKRRLNWQVVKNSIYTTARTWGMIAVIVFGATTFVGVYIALGGGRVVTNLMLELPFGTAGIITMMMLILFILGMFIDPGGIVLICAPVFSPIVAKLGINPLWFGVVFNVNLQMSFLTPPFGYALFFLKGVAPPTVTMKDLIEGAFPFVGLQAIGLIIVIAFPAISLWLPSMIVK